MTTLTQVLMADKKVTIETFIEEKIKVSRLVPTEAARNKTDSFDWNDVYGFITIDNRFYYVNNVKEITVTWSPIGGEKHEICS